MDVLTFETYCAVNTEIIKQVTSSWSIFIQLWRSVLALSLKSGPPMKIFNLFVSRITMIRYTADDLSNIRTSNYLFYG